MPLTWQLNLRSVLEVASLSLCVFDFCGMIVLCVYSGIVKLYYFSASAQPFSVELLKYFTVCRQVSR